MQTALPTRHTVTRGGVATGVTMAATVEATTVCTLRYFIA
jgi:hypothetical protein